MLVTLIAFMMDFVSCWHARPKVPNLDCGLYYAKASALQYEPLLSVAVVIFAITVTIVIFKKHKKNKDE